MKTPTTVLTGNLTVHMNMYTKVCSVNVHMCCFHMLRFLHNTSPHCNTRTHKQTNTHTHTVTVTHTAFCMMSPAPQEHYIHGTILADSSLAHHIPLMQSIAHQELHLESPSCLCNGGIRHRMQIIQGQVVLVSLRTIYARRSPALHKITLSELLM